MRSFKTIKRERLKTPRRALLEETLYKDNQESLRGISQRSQTILKAYSQ